LIYRYRLTNSIRVLALVALPFCSNDNFQAQTPKPTPARTHPPSLARRMAQTQSRIIRHNEQGALMSLQKLFSAEATEAGVIRAAERKGAEATLANDSLVIDP